MEKIENIADLEIGVAKTSAKALISLIEGLEYAAPEDMPGIEVRRREIARRLAEVAVALRVTPRRNAADAPTVHDLQQRVSQLEDNIRRHRDQRAVILDAIGIGEFDAAAQRIREIRAELADVVRELPPDPGRPYMSALRVRDLVVELHATRSLLADVRAELPPGDDALPITGRVRQLVREHRELTEEMLKGADAEDVIAAATHPVPASSAASYIDVVFDGPPGHVSGRFVEVEDQNGRSINVGEWIQRGNGYWALRIARPPAGSQDAEPQPAIATIAVALTTLAAVVSTSMVDWKRSPCLAWVYGALVGHPADAIEDLQVTYGWPDETVDDMSRARAAILAARGHGVL